MAAAPPTTLDELWSPRWLTEALDPRFPGIKVTDVVPGPVISRVATNARFRIACAGGVPEGLSPDLCGKGYFNEEGQAFRRAGIPEVFFYRDVAARVGVRTLRSVYAELGTDGNPVVLTHDVVAEGATFLDARSDYTPEQAADSLAELARLHAATWNDPALAAMPALRPRLATYLESRGLPEIRSNFDGPIGAAVPDEARDADRLVAAYRALIAEQDTGTATSVIHGDAHVGNLYLDGAGRPSFVDWQLVQLGPWYLDVGYHIASTLTVADRRRTENDLLRHYLDQLAAQGVSDVGGAGNAQQWEKAWQGLRRGFLHGFFLWGITLRVDPAVTSVLLERLGTAAADHGAFAALGV